MLFLTAKRLGCSVDTIGRYCQRYPTVAAARDEERGAMVDEAELRLWRAIQDGQAWAIAFCLKTLGKDRGYTERQEIAGSDGSAVTFHVVYESPRPQDVPEPPRGR